MKDLEAAAGACDVEIEGRDVPTGEARSLEGRVVETAIGDTGEVATMTVDTGDRRVTVGGRGADAATAGRSAAGSTGFRLPPCRAHT